jgi:hypothetical protein
LNDNDSTEVTSVDNVTKEMLDTAALEMAKQPGFMDKSMRDIREELSAKLNGADLSSKPARAMVKVCHHFCGVVSSI